MEVNYATILNAVEGTFKIKLLEGRFSGNIVLRIEGIEPMIVIYNTDEDGAPCLLVTAALLSSCGVVSSPYSRVERSHLTLTSVVVLVLLRVCRKLNSHHDAWQRLGGNFL